MHSKPIRRGAHWPLLKPPVVYLYLCWATDRNRRRHDCIIASITEIIYTSIISPSAHISRALFPSLYCHYSSLITTFSQLRHAKNSSQRQKHRCVSNNSWMKRELSECVWGWCTCLPYNPCSSPAQTHACCSYSYAVLRHAFTHAVLWDSAISSEESFRHVCMVPNKQTRKTKLLLRRPTRIHLIRVTAPKNKMSYFVAVTLV